MKNFSKLFVLLLCTVFLFGCNSQNAVTDSLSKECSRYAKYSKGEFNGKNIGNLFEQSYASLDKLEVALERDPTNTNIQEAIIGFRFLLDFEQPKTIESFRRWSAAGMYIEQACGITMESDNYTTESVELKLKSLGFINIRVGAIGSENYKGRLNESPWNLGSINMLSSFPTESDFCEIIVYKSSEMAQAHFSWLTLEYPTLRDQYLIDKNVTISDINPYSGEDLNPCLSKWQEKV